MPYKSSIRHREACADPISERVSDKWNYYGSASLFPRAQLGTTVPWRVLSRVGVVATIGEWRSEKGRKDMRGEGETDWEDDTICGQGATKRDDKRRVDAGITCDTRLGPRLNRAL